jgi:copper chaperone CopZ
MTCGGCSGAVSRVLAGLDGRLYKIPTRCWRLKASLHRHEWFIDLLNGLQHLSLGVKSLEVSHQTKKVIIETDKLKGTQEEVEQKVSLNRTICCVVIDNRMIHLAFRIKTNESVWNLLVRRISFKDSPSLASSSVRSSRMPNAILSFVYSLRWRPPCNKLRLKICSTFAVLTFFCGTQ